MRTVGHEATFKTSPRVSEIRCAVDASAPNPAINFPGGNYSSVSLAATKAEGEHPNCFLNDVAYALWLS